MIILIPRQYNTHGPILTNSTNLKIHSPLNPAIALLITAFPPPASDFKANLKHKHKPNHSSANNP